MSNTPVLTIALLMMFPVCIPIALFALLKALPLIVGGLTFLGVMWLGGAYD